MKSGHASSKELPIELEDLLSSCLEKGSKQLQDSVWMEDFRRSVRFGCVPDYPKTAVPFNYLYFGSNFFKAEFAVEKLIRRPQIKSSRIRVLDIGCGAGASSAAFLQAMHKQFPNMCMDFYGIDNNDDQLGFYKCIFGHWAETFPDINVFPISADALKYLQDSKDSWDIIICSYLFAEQTKAQKEFLINLLETKHRASGTQVLIIDSDPETLKPTAWSQGKSVMLLPSRIKIKFRKLHLLSQNCCPKYCKHKTIQLTATEQPSLLNKYFFCWQKHDLNILRELFSEDVTYEINGQRTLRGLSELVEYWTNNGRTQQNVVSICHHVFSAPFYNIIANWSSYFHRTDKQQFYCIHGIIWMDFMNGKITALREFYSRNSFPLVGKTSSDLETQK